MPDFLENAFYTAPFKKVLLAENFTEVPPPEYGRDAHLSRQVPLLAKGQTVCLLGEGPALGNWNTASARLLRRAGGEDYFSVPLDLRGQPFPLAYKYGVFDVGKKSSSVMRTAPTAFCRTPSRRANTPSSMTASAAARRIWRGAGVAVPVFSLRSEHSFGVGEFADLKRLADWGSKIGLKLIQLLPVNDTSATTPGRIRILTPPFPRLRCTRFI